MTPTPEYAENLPTIDTHHDGHGLNEDLTIVTDAPDHVRGGGASHQYRVFYRLHDHRDPAQYGGLPRTCAEIQFQHGPRNEDGSTAGITEAVLLAILIDRLRGFQAGPFACRENAIILTKLEECLMWTKERAHARAKRGVLGKNEK